MLTFQPSLLFRLCAVCLLGHLAVKLDDRG